MTAEGRGSDLNSWWENRAAYRKAAIQAAEQWQAAAAAFRQAAGNAQPGVVPESPADSLAEVTSRGNAAIQSLRDTSARISALNDERAGVDAQFASEESQIRQSCAERVHRQRQGQHQKDHQSRVRAGKAGVWLRKCFGLVVFGVTAYILLRY